MSTEPPPASLANRPSAAGLPRPSGNGVVDGRGALVAVMLCGGGALIGCGDIQFVPSPFTPRTVEVIYSEQEDVSVIRWSTESKDPLKEVAFEIDNGRGTFYPIDFGNSVFAGGVARCGLGACAQFVWPGRYPWGPGMKPVRARHRSDGVLSGLPATGKTLATTLAAKSFFLPGNKSIEADLADAIGGDKSFPFPRPFEKSVWPTTGLCLPDVVPTDAAWGPYPGASFPAPDPLTDIGQYCVAVRPLKQDGHGGAGVEVPVRILTVPEVFAGMHSFEPPVEVTPIFYQLVLDLEIPVVDRCGAAIDGIEAAFAKAFAARGAPVKKMPTIDLAAGGGPRTCHQSVDRVLDEEMLASAVKDVVTRELPEKHQRFHLVYLNNLRAALPPALSESLARSIAFLAAPFDLQTIAWGLGPDEMTSSFPFAMHTAWLAADDPSFPLALGDYATPNLPYRSQEHDPDELIEFVDIATVRAYAGDLIKICLASPDVTPMRHGAPLPPGTVAWPLDATEVPAYRVEIPQQIAVPDSRFDATTVLVRYEICTRYCGHGYRAESGAQVASWTGSTLCMGKGS